MRLIQSGWFFVSTALAFCAAAAVSPASALAQSSAALINRELDKPVSLDLKDVMLPDALRAIETKTGVPLKADPLVYELLPWGEDTPIRLATQNATLREGLRAVTQKLGLVFTLADEAVLLQPMPALRRYPGNRANAQELRALDVLASTPMPPAADKHVQTILAAIDTQLDKLKSPVAIENRLAVDPRNLNQISVEVPRGATMMEALEAVANQTAATWYPWERGVVVVPKETQVRDRLSRVTLTAHYVGADVVQVLEDLRKRSGVDFTFEPGALQKIPAAARTVMALWDNTSVAQALESLKGVTGLNYQVTDKGVTISDGASAAAVGAGGGADPVVATMTLENGLVVFIRDSQVPPDLKQYLRDRVQKQLDSVRTLANAQRAATQPAR